MEFLNYLWHCFGEALGAWAGVGNGSNDNFVGCAVLFVVGGVFALSAFLLDRFTKLKHWQATLCAVLIDIAFVFVFCLCAVVIEGAIKS